MIRLFDTEGGAPLGEITEEQFRFLMDRLEEESEEDDDYYINKATIEIFEAEGADPVLLDLLRKALGDREGMEIRWERENP